MKVKQLKKILERMDDEGVVEIALPVEGEPTWWDFEIGGDIDLGHALIKLTEIVMR